MLGAIGAGANVAGGAIQAVAAMQAKRAMGKVYEREIVQQNKIRNQALGNVFQPALQTRGVEQARSDIATGRGEREASYEDLGNVDFTGGQQAPGGEDPRGLANFELMGNLRAQLGAYSDWGLENLIRQIRSQEQLNRLSDTSRGRASTFPARMYDAQHSADQLAMVGNLISSVGGGAQGWGELFGLGQNPTPQKDYGYSD
jgi:hypothetical protein